MAYIHGTAQEEQTRLAALNALTNPRFLRFLAPSRGSRVLEVGSGLGILARAVAERVSLAVGLELSEDQLRHAPTGFQRLSFVRGDAHELPFRENFFDLVYCRYLLEHVADPAAVAREMFRVLRPGGAAKVQENDILIATFEPDCPAFEEIWRRFASFQSELGGNARIGKKLFALLSGAGFRDVRLSLAPEVHHAGQESYALWLDNLIGNVRSAERAMIARKAASAREIDEACGELESLKRRPDGAAFFYWTRAEGTKAKRKETR